MERVLVPANTWGHRPPAEVRAAQLYVSLTLPSPLRAPRWGSLLCRPVSGGVVPQMATRPCNPCRSSQFITSKTCSRSEQTLLNQGLLIRPVWAGGCNYCKQKQTCKEKMHFGDLIDWRGERWGADSAAVTSSSPQSAWWCWFITLYYHTNWSSFKIRCIQSNTRCI